MADYTLALKITGDGRLAVQAVNDVTTATKGMGQTATRASTDAAQSFKLAGNAAVTMDAQIQRTISTLGHWAAAVGSLEVAKEFAAQIVEANNQLIGWQYGLQAATGSTQKAAEAMSFIRSISDKLGTSLVQNASAFTQLAAATRGTSIEGAKTEQIFTGITEASRALHLTSQQSASALLALTQMMSKGTIQSQDLKLQLAQVLPSAMKNLADALGVTQQKLTQMMDAGQILSEDALPKLAAELHKVYGATADEAAGAAPAELQRLKNAVFDLKAAIGNAGFMDLLGASASEAASGMEVLGENIQAVQTLVIAFGVARAASAATNLVSSRLAQAETIKLAAVELDEAKAAQAEAAAQLEKVSAFAAVTSGSANVLRAEAALTAAELRTAEATAVANAANVARVGLFARMGSGLLSLVGGPIGAAVLALGALAAAWIAVNEAEKRRQQAFESTLSQMDEANKKAQDLHATLISLASVPPPPLADSMKALLDEYNRVAEAQEAVAKKQAEVNGLLDQYERMQASGNAGAAVLQQGQLGQREQELKQLQQRLDDVRSSSNLLGDDLQQRFAPAVQAAATTLTNLRNAANLTDLFDDLTSGANAYAAAVSKTLTADATAQQLAKKISNQQSDVATKLQTAGKTQVQIAKDEAKAQLDAAKAAGWAPAAITAQQKLNQTYVDSVAKLQALSKKHKDLTKTDQAYQDAERQLAQKAAETVNTYINKTETPLQQAWNDYATVVRNVAQAEGERIQKAIDAAKAGDKNVDVAKVEADAQRATAQAIDDLSAARDRNVAAAKRQMDVAGKMIQQLQQQAQLSTLSQRDQAIARAGMDYETQVREKNLGLTNDQVTAQKQQVEQAAAAAYDMQKYAEQQNQIAQEFAGFWSNAATSISKEFGDLFTGQIHDLKDFTDQGKSILQQWVSDIIAQFLRLRVLGPILGGAMQTVAGLLGITGDLSSSGLSINNGYYGGGSTVGTAAGTAGAATGAATGNASYASYLQQGVQGYKLYNWIKGGSLFGGASAASPAYAGSASVIDAGGSIGGNYGAAAGGMYAPGYAPVGGAAFNVGAPAYTPWGGSFSVGGYSAPYASAAGGLLGAYYGAHQGGGGFSTGVSTVGYGALGAGIAGTAAGVAGGASLGTAAGSAFGAAAASTSWIPIVGWIMAGLAVLDHFSDGKVFGSGWKPAQSNVALGIGPDGSSASANETLWKYKGQTGISLKGALTGGLSQISDWGDKKTKTQQLDVTPEMLAAAQALYDNMEKVLVSGAQKLGIDVPDMITASLTAQTTYNKKGKATGTEYLVQYLGQTWKEATADAAAQRLGADALLSVVAQSAGDVAFKIAKQWQDSADTLEDGVQTLLAAQQDIVRGNSLVALGSTATLQEVIAFTQSLQASGEALADTYARLQQASQAYVQFVGQFTPTSTDFGASLEAIATQMQANIDQANQLAQAAGMQGAAESDLANIHQQAAVQAADAIAQLNSAAQDLAAQMYDVTNGTLSAVSAQLDKLQGKTQSALQLAIGDNSPYSDQQKLDLALQGLRSGLTSADDVLSLGRKLYASSADYTGLYNKVQDIMGLPGSTGQQSLQDALTQYNGLSSQQSQLQDQANAASRYSDAKTLAQYVSEISTTHGIGYTEAAQGLGFNLSDLAKDLGITNITGYLDQLKLQDIPGSTMDASASIVDAIQKLGRDLIQTLTAAPITSATGVIGSTGTASAAQTALLKSIDQRLAAIEQSSGDTANTNKTMVGQGASQKLNDLTKTTRGGVLA